MKFRRGRSMKALRIAIMSALAFQLVSCGGGGGGVSSAPNPPPAPPPENTSLNPITVSQSFANDGAKGSATYSSDGSAGVAGKATTAALTVHYDAPSKTYTITDGARSQSFSANDISLSSTPLTIYKKDSSAVTDTLSLTKPGTSGAFAYQYVGAGVWQNTIINASNITGTVDVFTYGVKTSDAQLPRTGGAGYAVDINGIIAPGLAGYDTPPISIAGSGTLSVNFINGYLTSQGTFSQVYADGIDLNSPGSFFATGAMTGGSTSSNPNYTNPLPNYSNGIAGSIRINGALRTLTGSFSGKFYGPSANEVGLTFYANSADGGSALGYIIGRQDNDVTTDFSTLSSLKKISNLYVGVAGQGIGSASGTFVGGGSYGSTFNPYGIMNADDLYFTQDGDWLQYNPSSEDFTFNPTDFVKVNVGNLPPLTQFSVGSNEYLPAQPDARYKTYHTTQGLNDLTVKIYRFGGDNPELQLTYLSFASIETVVRSSTTSNSSVVGKVFNFLPFGLPTRQNVVPTGGATFSGIISGAGILPISSTSVFNDNISISGTANISIGLNNPTAVDVTLSPVAFDAVNNTTTALGTFTYNAGPYGIGSSSSYFRAISVGSAIGTANDVVVAPSSNLAGAFFGPSATEAGGLFTLDLNNTGSGPNTIANSIRSTGVFVTKKN